MRTTASGFCYHFGVAIGGFVTPVASYFAVEQHVGFAAPMLIGTVGGSLSVVIALLAAPRPKAKSSFPS